MLEVAQDGVKHNPDEGIYHFFYGEALMPGGADGRGDRDVSQLPCMELPPPAKEFIESTSAGVRQGGK